MSSQLPQIDAVPHEPTIAEQRYRSSSLIAIAGSVGIVVGSVAPWIRVLVFSINGIDFSPWGVVTLALGTLCGVAMTVQFCWGRTPFDMRWAIPVTWMVFVAAAICCATALCTIAGVMTASKPTFLGLPIGLEVGWGLWLVCCSAALVCLAALAVSAHIVRRSVLPGSSRAGSARPQPRHTAPNRPTFPRTQAVPPAR